MVSYVKRTILRTVERNVHTYIIKQKTNNAFIEFFKYFLNGTRATTVRTPLANDVRAFVSASLPTIGNNLHGPRPPQRTPVVKLERTFGNRSSRYECLRPSALDF